MSFGAVIFDWRGTLVTTVSWSEWAGYALRRSGRDGSDEQVRGVVATLRSVPRFEDRLDCPGIDADAAFHREVYFGVFADAGLDDELARALYAVESDPSYNHFAQDTEATLRELHRRGIRVAVVSDIHFDVRPAFDAVGLSGLVDTFTLSFEEGVQKPDPLMFTRTLAALGCDPAAALMVGDRPRPDGGAVECGITTLLLPSLRNEHHQRLHHVLAMTR
ncbi:MAG TPA: HAD family hydrolase [Acidothermaceae bacterium]